MGFRLIGPCDVDDVVFVLEVGGQGLAYVFGPVLDFVGSNSEEFCRRLVRVLDLLTSSRKYSGYLFEVAIL